MKTLVLMTTLGCHLCDEAEAILIPLIEPLKIIIEAQDIADEDALIEKYGERIPVLVCEESGKELNWPFTSHQVVSFVQELA